MHLSGLLQRHWDMSIIANEKLPRKQFHNFVNLRGLYNSAGCAIGGLEGTLQPYVAHIHSIFLPHDLFLPSIIVKCFVRPKTVTYGNSKWCLYVINTLLISRFASRPPYRFTGDSLVVRQHDARQALELVSCRYKYRLSNLRTSIMNIRWAWERFFFIMDVPRLFVYW